MRSADSLGCFQKKSPEVSEEQRRESRPRHSDLRKNREENEGQENGHAILEGCHLKEEIDFVCVVPELEPVGGNYWEALFSSV